VVSTHLKNISQNGNLPQIGMKIKKFKPPTSRLSNLYLSTRSWSSGFELLGRQEQITSRHVIELDFPKGELPASNLAKLAVLNLKGFPHPKPPWIKFQFGHYESQCMCCWKKSILGYSDHHHHHHHLLLLLLMGFLRVGIPRALVPSRSSSSAKKPYSRVSTYHSPAPFGPGPPSRKHKAKYENLWTMFCSHKVVKTHTPSYKKYIYDIITSHVM